MLYEEPYRGRNRKNRSGRSARRRRRSFGGWLVSTLLKLLALALTLTMAGGALLYALPVSFFQVEPEGADLSLTPGLPPQRVCVLLLGLDALHENARRSDSIVIASIGAGEVKLASVLRDTVLDIPGHGPGKLNAAYAWGGPELVMKTLNENLKLDIMRYMAVDYAALIRLVDALGGVEVTITPAEMEKINQTIDRRRARWEALGYIGRPLTLSGEGVLLDGVQALTYARIRKLDSDFMRTSRQRALLKAMLNRLKASLTRPARLARFLKVLATAPESNMPPLQWLSLGEKALAWGVTDQLRLPVEGSYTDDGSSLQVDDLQMNVGALQLFLYGQ